MKLLGDFLQRNGQGLLKMRAGETNAVGALLTNRKFFSFRPPCPPRSPSCMLCLEIICPLFAYVWFLCVLCGRRARRRAIDTLCGELERSEGCLTISQENGEALYTRLRQRRYAEGSQATVAVALAARVALSIRRRDANISSVPFHSHSLPT